MKRVSRHVCVWEVVLPTCHLSSAGQTHAQYQRTLQGGVIVLYRIQEEGKTYEVTGTALTLMIGRCHQLNSNTASSATAGSTVTEWGRF